MLTPEQTCDKLQYILGTLRDGENGYRDAAEHASDPQLKRLFSDFSDQRRQLAGQIENLLANLGEKPREGGSVGAALHRGWLNLRDALSGRDDYAVVAEAERGEDAAVQNYQDVLKEALPADVKELLEQQYSTVKASHDRVRDLKQGMEANRRA